MDEESVAVVLVSWSIYKRNSYLKPLVGYEWDFLPLQKSSLDNVFYKPLSHTQLHDCPIQEASYSNKHVNENHLYNLPITTTTNQQKEKCTQQTKAKNWSSNNPQKGQYTRTLHSTRYYHLYFILI